MKKLAVIVSVLLLVPAWLAHSSTWRSPALIIRIDAAGRIWWNKGVAKLSNPPRLIPALSGVGVEDTYVPDFLYLRSVLHEKCALTWSGALLLIVIHPESHYLCFNNVLALIEEMRKDDDSLGVLLDRLGADTIVTPSLNGSSEGKRGTPRSRMLGPATVASETPRFRVSFRLVQWASRDDRIVQFAAEHAGVPYTAVSSAPTEHQFKHRWESGFWRDRIPDSLFTIPPEVTAPKVGIPGLIAPSGEEEDLNSSATKPPHE